jgi:4-hydroxybenzoate polyprenyltransferase
MARPPFTKGIIRLLFNHVDAWQVAVVVATLPLLIHRAISLQTTLLLAAIGLGYWFAFALNDYYDAPFDAIDTRKARRNYFVHTAVSHHILWPIVILILTGLVLIFAQFGRTGYLILAVSCFILWAYSAPPFRFKMKPGLDLFIHAFFVQTYPYAISLVLIEAVWTTLDVIILTILALASLTAQLEQQARDYTVDTRTGRTFTTTIGLRSSRLLLKWGTAVCILTALINVLIGTIPWFILPFGVIGLPALLHRFLRHEEKPRSERLVVASTTVGFLYTGIIFVYFLLF